MVRRKKEVTNLVAIVLDHRLLLRVLDKGSHTRDIREFVLLPSPNQKHVLFFSHAGDGEFQTTCRLFDLSQGWRKAIFKKLYEILTFGRPVLKIEHRDVLLASGPAGKHLAEFCAGQMV